MGERDDKYSPQGHTQCMISISCCNNSLVFIDVQKSTAEVNEFDLVWLKHLQLELKTEGYRTSFQTLICYPLFDTSTYSPWDAPHYRYRGSSPHRPPPARSSGDIVS